jgi:hypothetical protein
VLFLFIEIRLISSLICQNINLKSDALQYPLQASVPFTSRYLKIVKPVIVATLSKQVFIRFHTNSFKDCFINALENESVLEFLTNPGTLKAQSDLDRISEKQYRFIKDGRYTSYSGNVYLCSYGPDVDDLVLVTSIRHPGNVFYDPALQSLQSTEILLSLCCLELLESIARQFLIIQGGTRPEDRDELFRLLIAIKTAYEEQVRSSYEQ